MATKKSKKFVIKVNDKALNEDTLMNIRTLLDTRYNEALDGRDDKADRFRKSYLYLRGELPDKKDHELSSYVLPVLRKAVDAVKPSLMNIFTENEKNAVFLRPTKYITPDISRHIDDKINQIFLRENAGYDLVDKLITEALVTGDVFLKVFVEEYDVEEEVTLDNENAEVITMLLEEYPETDVEALRDSLTEKDGLVSGTVQLVKTVKDVKVEFVPFSNIVIAGDSEDIKDTRYVCHILRKSVGELIDLGFDENILESASNVSANDEFALSTSDLVNKGTFGSGDVEDNACIDPLEREINLYEHYTYTSLVDGKVKLYCIYATDTEILEIKEVSTIPFVHGVANRIPGCFWGVSLYDIFKDAQDIASHHTRTLQYYAARSAFGKYQAIKGQYDRRSLLNNRPGAVIEVETAGAVAPFVESQDIGPVSEALAQITNSYREDMQSAVGVDVTGSNMSATAAAITANSANMKDKVYARSLANTLFKPMFEHLYEIIRSENMLVAEVPNPAFAEFQTMAQEAQASGMSAEEIQATGSQIPQTIKYYGSQFPRVVEFIIDVSTENDDSIQSNQLIQLLTLKSQVGQAVTDEAFNKLAMKVTGMSEEEVKMYFEAKAPSPEEMQAAQQQQELAMQSSVEQLKLIQAQTGLAAAQSAKEISTAQQTKLEGEAKRKREDTKLEYEGRRLDMQEKELNAELNGAKIQIGAYK